MYQNPIWYEHNMYQIPNLIWAQYVKNAQFNMSAICIKHPIWYSQGTLEVLDYGENGLNRIV